MVGNLEVDTYEINQSTNNDEIIQPTNTDEIIQSMKTKKSLVLRKRRLVSASEDEFG